MYLILLDVLLRTQKLLHWMDRTRIQKRVPWSDWIAVVIGLDLIYVADVQEGYDRLGFRRQNTSVLLLVNELDDIVRNIDV